MRKLTIVFLALCIVLSVAPGAFAAEEVSDSALKAYGLLSALGIMDSDGVNVEDFLSYNARRDDLVYWAMRAVGWGDDSLEDKGYAVFNDVPAEDIKCRYEFYCS